MELRKINGALKKVGIVLVVEFDRRSERELIAGNAERTSTKLYFQKWSTYQRKAKRKSQSKKAVSK